MNCLGLVRVERGELLANAVVCVGQLLHGMQIEELVLFHLGPRHPRNDLQPSPDDLFTLTGLVLGPVSGKPFLVVVAGNPVDDRELVPRDHNPHMIDIRVDRTTILLAEGMLKHRARVELDVQFVVHSVPGQCFFHCLGNLGPIGWS